MGARVLAFFALVALGAALSADFSDATWRERPITKVIRLLKDMQAQMQKEAKEDSDMFDKLTCWCDTNSKEKTKAIADANQKIADLTAAIEEYAAKSSQLETEIEKLDEDVAKETSALDKATEIREKEASEFAAEEKDMTATAATLKSAVGALSKAQGGAALSQESLMQVKAVLRHHMKHHHKSLSKHQHTLAMSLLQEDAGLRSAQPASGAIFGILKQMKEGFETNLADSQKDEEQASSEYASLKATKEEQIKASSDLSESKSVQLAEAGDKRAQAKEDLVDTEAQLEADTEFLASLKEKCEAQTKAYQEREKVRSEEITAVSETLGILTDDEAQQAFSKSMSFVQLSLRRTGRRAVAAGVVRKVGAKFHNSALIQLATKSMMMDPFAKVKQNIDTMVAELKNTQKEEDEKKEYCNTEIKQNERDSKAKKGRKADIEQQIEDLGATVTKLADEIKNDNAQINTMQVEMKDAGVLREKESADFQVTVQDQRATVVILNKALDRLKAFYDKKAALLQVASTNKQHAPNAVMLMIEGIIKEAKDIEAKALKEENEAQADYETFIKESNTGIKALQEGVINKSEAMAKADKEKVLAADDLKHTIAEILALGKASAALHNECDWLLKNHAAREDARAEEIDALNNAKAILSGANFGFIQQQEQQAAMEQ